MWPKSYIRKKKLSKEHLIAKILFKFPDEDLDFSNCIFEYPFIKNVICKRCNSIINKHGYKIFGKRQNFCNKCCRTIKKRFTIEKVNEILKKINYELVGNYNGYHNLNSIKCLTCGNIEYNRNISAAFENEMATCERCRNKKEFGIEIITNAEIDKIVNSKQIKRLGEYVNKSEKLPWECLKCGHKWNITTRIMLKPGTKCPKCTNCTGFVHTNESVDKLLIERNIKIKRIGNYINRNIKIEWECLKCGNKWMAQPLNIYTGDRGCPKCRQSKGELKIEQYLFKNNIKYESQKTFVGCVYLKQLYFDFYLPDYNILIEFQGKQHYQPVKHFGGINNFNNDYKRDNAKIKYCNDNNISLIEVPYWEERNIDVFLNEKLKQYKCV